MNNLRRMLLAGGVALFSPKFAFSQHLVPIADAHNHFGLLKNNRSSLPELKSLMSKSGVSLLSWTVVPDVPFLSFSGSKVAQSRVPEKGELNQSFARQLKRAVDAINANGLNLIRNQADLTESLKGVPSIVLTSEGADFLEGSLENLKPAVAAGIRHVQLVHYIRNDVGDIQTETEVHGGLTSFGKSLISALNQYGVLIDLAHGTQDVVLQALEISKAPMIWSHSYLSQSHGVGSQQGYQSRGIGVDMAKRIAASGGAVGLWALGPSFGGGIGGYADEIKKMVDILGPEHVMFGTDIDGLPTGSAIDDFEDLRKVVERLQKQGMSDKTIQAVAYGNYARCLSKAMGLKRPEYSE